MEFLKLLLKNEIVRELSRSFLLIEFKTFLCIIIYSLLVKVFDMVLFKIRGWEELRNESRVGMSEY